MIGRWIRFCVALITTAGMCLASNSGAEFSKRSVTTIKVSGLHCQFCAKRLADKLKQLPDVQASSVSFKNSVATIEPIPAKSLSPRALWEQVEKAGCKPIELIGPSGRFVSKPKDISLK